MSTSQPASPEAFVPRNLNNNTSDNEESKPKNLNIADIYTNSLFNNTSVTNNSSGLGDSISLPSMSADCSSSSSSVYGGCNTVNAAYSSCSSSDSVLDQDILQMQPKNNVKIKSESFSGQRVASQKPVSPENTLNNLSHQFNVLNLNQVDYDPFNDYMGIDKMILQMAGVDAQKAAKGNFNLDPQQHQQIIAQALAAVASSTNANSSTGITSTPESSQNKPASNRSLTENIELLNSKFIKSQNNGSALSGFDKYSDKHGESNSSSLSSLLATVAAHNLQSSNNNSDTNMGYNSANLPINLKRQSYPLANQQAHFNAFSSTLNNTPAQSSNSRLNSTPNLYNSNNDLVSNRVSNYNQNLEKSVPGSMSASNSSFNFNLSNEIDLPSRGNNTHHQAVSSANNSSCYDDDEVFSTNNSFNTQSLQQQHQSHISSSRHLENGSSLNIDAQALAQLYRNILAGNGNTTSNSASSNGRNTDNISASLSELLASYNANLAALSLNPDLINSTTFLNSTNSMANQIKTLNSLANNNNSSASNQYNNNHNSSSNYSQRQGSSNSANLEQITAAVLKQRQMLQSGRSGSGNPSSNIAALTSATSNIASLLNLNNANVSQGNQHQGHGFLDSSLKRRSMNSTNFGTSGSNNNSSPVSSAYGNASSLFGSSNLGPNASHILQNSSLASSARLNSATSNSAAASVLGNNSSLHALTSLQHQSSSGLSNHHNSSQMNSNGNGHGSGSSQQHHQSNLLNFNMSPSSSSNHGILSALSLSSTSGNSLQNQLLSASGKPLRSERLPNHIVEEIVKQAKIRRRNGGKKEVCVFCRNNGEKEQIYTSHTLKDAHNHVACPILRLYQCPICHASGDQAHTIKYCPYAEKDSNCIKLFKENGRMSAAAAFLMNSLAGGNTSPSLSPPATPPPSNSANHSLMHHNNLDMMQSPGQHQNSINAYLNNSLNFNLGSSGFGKINNEICSNLNKPFSSSSSILNCSSTASNTATANAANSILTSRDSSSSLLSSNFSNGLNK